MKKKLKRKKKRLKENVRLWEESRRCSGEPNDEPEAAEPPSKKNATDDGRTSKQGTGMPVWSCVWIHAMSSCFHANTDCTVVHMPHVAKPLAFHFDVHVNRLEPLPLTLTLTVIIKGDFKVERYDWQQ